MKNLTKNELETINAGSWWTDLWYNVGYTTAKKQYEATCPGGKYIPNPSGSYPAAICVRN